MPQNIKLVPNNQLTPAQKNQKMANGQTRAGYMNTMQNNANKIRSGGKPSFTTGGATSDKSTKAGQAKVNQMGKPKSKPGPLQKATKGIHFPNLKNIKSKFEPI